MHNIKLLQWAQPLCQIVNQSHTGHNWDCFFMSLWEITKSGISDEVHKQIRLQLILFVRNDIELREEWTDPEFNLGEDVLLMHDSALHATFNDTRVLSFEGELFLKERTSYLPWIWIQVHFMRSNVKVLDIHNENWSESSCPYFLLNGNAIERVFSFDKVEDKVVLMGIRWFRDRWHFYFFYYYFFLHL